MKEYLKKMLILLLALPLGACSFDTQTQEDPQEFIHVVEINEPTQGAQQRLTETQEPAPQYSEYNIYMDINPDTGIIRGTERVIFNNKTGANLEDLVFNLYLNAFAKEYPYQPYFNEHTEYIFKNGRDYGYIEISSVLLDGSDLDYTMEHTWLQVHLDNTLQPGATVEISLQFEAYIPKINHRTGSNDYAMWMGNFLPVLAVFEDGAWRMDRYHPAGDPFYMETADYNVTITAPSDYIIVATGVETSQTDGDTRTTTVNAKMVRDFAFTVIHRSYKIMRRYNQNGIEINIYYRSNISNIDSYINAVEQSLDYYSETIGLYPYSQLDIVEVGLFIRGGMEYSQIIFIDDEFFQTPSAISTLSHEIGHQWFYNIIGSDQINNAWLDEGLTMMLQENIFTDNQKEITQKFERDYQDLSGRLTSANAYLLADDLGEFKTWSDYYNTHYTKGKLMVYSLSQLMGEEKFNEFLRTYYQRYSFKIAGVNDFIETAEEIYEDSLDAFFESWLYGRDLPSLYN